MGHRSSFIATVAVLALGSIAVGVCCAPLLGAGSDVAIAGHEMPMEHGDGHQDHDALAFCCAGHDTQIPTESVVVIAPAAVALEFEPHTLRSSATERYAWDARCGEPPGIRDLNSTLCTLII